MNGESRIGNRTFGLSDFSSAEVCELRRSLHGAGLLSFQFDGALLNTLQLQMLVKAPPKSHA